MRVGHHVLLTRLLADGYRRGDVPTREGVLRYVEAEGEGGLPPVVILHGLSANGATYAPLLRRLRPHVRRVIAVDMPGHGHSDRPRSGMGCAGLDAMLSDAVQRLATEPVVLFGNSLGGAAAIRLAARHPDCVRGLALAAPGGAPIAADRLATFKTTFQLDRHADALAFVDRLFHRPPPYKHVLAWGIRQQFAQSAVAELLSEIAPADFLRPEELQAIEAPTLVMWGEADGVFGEAERRFFEAHLPTHVDFRRLTRFGHVPHLCHPDALAQHVLGLLRRCAEASPGTKATVTPLRAARPAAANAA